MGNNYCVFCNKFTTNSFDIIYNEVVVCDKCAGLIAALYLKNIVTKEIHAKQKPAVDTETALSKTNVRF